MCLSEALYKPSIARSAQPSLLTAAATSQGPVCQPRRPLMPQQISRTRALNLPAQAFFFIAAFFMAAFFMAAFIAARFFFIAGAASPASAAALAFFMAFFMPFIAAFFIAAFFIAAFIAAFFIACAPM